MIVWHGTSAIVRESIMAKGLLPSAIVLGQWVGPYTTRYRSIAHSFAFRKLAIRLYEEGFNGDPLTLPPES